MEYGDPYPRRNLPLYVTLILLSTTAVVLRLVVRIKTKTTLRGDDWWACLSLVLLHAYLGAYIWVSIKLYATGLIMVHATGSGSWTAEDKVLWPTYKLIYALGPISISTISAAKISIILLYRRVFLPDNAFRVASNVVGALCLLWWICFVFVLLFKCTPVHQAWTEGFDPKTCINLKASFLGGEILNFILDLAILLLPMRVIKKLKLPLAQKMTLCFIFIMGSFVGVISIIRIANIRYVFYSGKDWGSSNGTEDNWLQIQIAMAVICCCLPTYRPLLPNGTAIIASLVGLYNSISKPFSKKQRSEISSTNGSRNILGTRSRHDHYNDLGGHGDERDTSVLTHVVGAGAGRIEDCVPGRDYPMNAINVTKTVDLV